MLKTDALSQLKQLKQDIKASRNLQIGVVKGTPNKFGFVTVESGKDIFLPADEMAKVLPGDKVEIEVKKEPKNKVFGILERLIESPTKEFYGKYMTRGNAHFAVPDIAGLSQWFFIPPPKRKQAKANDYVHCKITQHPYKAGKAQAAVVEVLGNESEVGIEWDYNIRKHGLGSDWTEAALAEAKAIADIDADADDSREDLTSLPFVTIDSESAQDLDDALYAEVIETGWRLKVAIADPSSYIAADSELERELIKRASSVYLPGQNIPMLPKEISSDHCSLLEGLVRRAKVVEFDIDQSGETSNPRIYKAIIRSSAKLSYSATTEELGKAESDKPYIASLKELAKLSDALEAWRKSNALLPPVRDEFYLVLDEKKKISSIEPKELSKAHLIVESCMVAANCVVANFVAEHSSSSVYVSHAGVREDRVESLEKVVKEKRQKPVDLTKLSDYQSLNKELIEELPENTLFSLISRQQSRATISSSPKPHFAMGLERYTNFTSPLRKASDFMLHRQIDTFLNTREWIDISEEVLATIDEQAQATRAANYELEQWLKCQYLNKSKETFTAQVLRVFASGCQIRLAENGIEGFISARELEGKFSYDQDLMILKGQTYSFELDQELKVTLKMIDWKRKQLQFVPAS